MILESEILVQVLLPLIEHGVTALPIHDVMHACLEEATGFPGIVPTWGFTRG